MIFLQLKQSIFYILAKAIKKTHIPAIKNSQINKKTFIGSSSLLVNSSISRYSYVGNNCTVISADIGMFCSIANNVIIGGASHPMDWLSTSPVFQDGKNALKKNFSKIEYHPHKQTSIGNDVWIGDNVMVKSGVNISDGAVIGMGSVVTKDVGCYEVWAGCPARCISKRFKDDTVQKIKKSKWWELDDNILLSLTRFDDIDSVLNELDKINDN